jgi:trigger factor
MADTEAKTSVSDAGELKKRLEVEVPAPIVVSRLDRAFHTLQQRVRLRGFRPGKAPRTTLERLYGHQVEGEVVESLVREWYEQGLVQHHVVPVGPPEIVVEPLGDTRVLRFSATVDVCPEITVSNYEGIEVARPLVQVDDEAVDQILTRLAEAASTVRPIADRTRVEAGDIVTAQVTAVVDGRPLDDVRRKDAMIEAGSGSFPGALEERLVGLEVGTTTTINVQYPPDHANPQLSGKQVAFGVSVTALGEKVTPAIDDEFARVHAKCESLAELREKVRADLTRDAERKADAAVREAIVNALIERHPFDAPEAVVERRCDALISSLNVRLPEGPEGKEALATLRQELRPRAVRDGKAAILLDRLAAQHGLQVGEDEITERVNQIARASGAARGQAQEFYANDERREALRTQIMRERALELVVDRSKIRTVEKR